MNRTLGLGAVIVVSVCLVAPAALPCKNAIHKAEDSDIQMLVKAEKELRRSTRLRPIVASVTSRFKGLRYQGPPAGKGKNDGKLRRALAVMAVIAVRSKGKFAPDGRRVSKPKLKRMHMAWATATLQNLVRVRPANSRYKARWAEALLAEGKNGQARKLLEALASKDLMPDAKAYQTLALSRVAAGDVAGGKMAQRQCKKRSRLWHVCALPGDKADWELEEEKKKAAKKKAKGVS